MPSCIDLIDRYGDRYKIVSEDGSRTSDPWLQILLCRRGHICPYGGQLLMACTDRRYRHVTSQLLAVPSARICQDADDGINLTFHVDDFDTVAEIMRPRKRRKISPEHLAKLTAANAVYRFKGGSQVANGDRRSDPGEKPDYRAA
jgi:hypothetical protein